jgi:hypothetical protein
MYEAFGGTTYTNVTVRHTRCLLSQCTVSIFTEAEREKLYHKNYLAVLTFVK